MAEWICGRNPVFEVLRNGRRQVFSLRVAKGAQPKGRLEEIFRQAEAVGLPVERVPRVELDGMAPGHQGVALRAGPYPYVDAPQMYAAVEKAGEGSLVLILDMLQDPQNLGTLLRTSEAVGVTGVFLPYRRSVGITPAVSQASSGACEHLLVARVNLAQAIAHLKTQGLWVIGLENLPDALPPEQVRLVGPLALVVGSEGQGMRRLVRESCDLLLRLPMQGRVGSLNAATAGSIALYLVWQARGFKLVTDHFLDIDVPHNN